MNLLSRLFNFFEKYNRPVPTYSFGLFRILFCVHTLFIIANAFYFRTLIFDQVPGISNAVFPSKLFLVIWTISTVLLLIGFYTRYSALVHYVCVVIATSLFHSSNVGFFYDDYLRMGSLLCIFLPVSRSFSFDAFKAQLVFLSPPPPKTSFLNYLLFLFLTLGIVYTPSGITKALSDIWQHGLGIWVPASIPHKKWNTLPNLFLNQQWLMYFLNYFTIVWEILFAFLLFFPRTYFFLFISGIALHVGIALFFPFPLQSIGPIIFFTVFIPASFWDWIKRLTQSKKTLPIFIHEHNNTYIRYWRILHSLDFRNKYRQVYNLTNAIPLDSFDSFASLLKEYYLYKPLAAFLRLRLITYLLKLANRQWINPDFQIAYQFTTLRFRQIILICFCFLITFLQLWRIGVHCQQHITTSNNDLRHLYLLSKTSGYDLRMNVSSITRVFFGMNSRALFLDLANTGDKKIFAISYLDKAGNEHWLPIYDSRGYSNGKLNMNLIWPKMAYTLVNLKTGEIDSIGLKKLTKFWADKFNQDLDSLHMFVYNKTYIYPTHFEKDYYLNLEARPWQKAGEIWWKDSAFSFYPVGKDTLH